jgi:hypothetical protein
MQKSKLQRLSGVWLNSSANGTDYMTSARFREQAEIVVPVGGKLIMFTNGYKEKETDPDYVLYLDPGKEQEQIPF